MKQLLTIYKAVLALLHKPSRLNLVVSDNEFQKKLFQKKYPHHPGLPYVPLSSLVDVANTQVLCSFLEGGSLPTDYLLLKGLAKKQGGNYFEIGTWRGESVMNVAAHMQQCITLNLPKQTLVAQGASAAYANQMGHFIHSISNITQLFANSFLFDFESLPLQFNLIFIDGDHRYHAVKNDTQKVFQHLVGNHTIVVWHDYGLGPETTRWEVLRGILDGMPAAKQKHVYAVSNTLCAIYYPFKIESTFLSFPQTPKSLFEVRLLPK